MYDFQKHFVAGAWVDPIEGRSLDVVNPATEAAVGRIALGSAADVQRAVAAARDAFAAFSATTKDERLALLDAIIAAYQARYADIVAAITAEMGAPTRLSKTAQAASGLAHLTTMKSVLAAYPLSEQLNGKTRLFHEPVGVCGFITPWNWPINQIVCKVAPALAAGCTMVLKPSEVAPLSAHILADVLADAGVPAGVFNLVDGDGPTVGAAIAAHPDVDMVSFTGSTRAGRLVAKAAADSVKRVALELGGKSPNILLDDVDLPKAVKGAVIGCMNNSGQSCNAPTRLLVPAAMHDEAAQLAAEVANSLTVGNPEGDDTRLGPVVSQAQYDKIQRLIQAGIDEGAQLVAGGLGRPDGLDKGYYVKPTVFAGVNNAMTVSREEIFGPVLCLLPYADEAEAIAMANDTPYGLSAYVSSGDLDRARRVALQLRAGQVHVNGASADFQAPFGGYKQSGNGREWGRFGFEEFLEVKAVLGYGKVSS